jgi:hypothetical protein
MSKIAFLKKDLERAERALAAAERDEALAEKIAEHCATIWEELEGLLEAEERRQSKAPRRAAEARLAYHAENDTLDLY